MSYYHDDSYGISELLQIESNEFCILLITLEDWLSSKKLQQLAKKLVIWSIYLINLVFLTKIIEL